MKVRKEKQGESVSEKPKGNWRMGMELEKLLNRRNTNFDQEMKFNK